MSYQFRRKKEPMHSRESLRFQFRHSKNVRWDLVDVMLQTTASTISFKYGKKKWVANRRLEIIHNVPNDAQYSLHDINLKPGDIILWGEHNWYCTFGIEDIVSMEKYAEKTAFSQHNADLPERKQGIVDDQGTCNVSQSEICEENKAAEAKHQQQVSSNGSQFCASQNNLTEPHYYTHMEHDEDLIDHVTSAHKYFIERELKRMRDKEIAYLPSPLKIGDVIEGPGESKGKWIVSKKWILRRTYENDVNRHDIKIKPGHFFDVGDMWHLAMHYMDLYISVSRFIPQEQVKDWYRARNKRRRRQEIEEEKRSNNSPTL